MIFYRIKQIDENWFIPQICEGIWDMIFGSWYGIQILDSKLYFWYSDGIQEEYCAYPSLEHAENVIKACKKYYQKILKYPKYHKVPKIIDN